MVYEFVFLEASFCNYPPKQGILFCKGLFLAYSKGDRRNREKFYVDLGGFKGYFIIIFSQLAL